MPRLAPPAGARVLVVGGAGGIGRALVAALAASGCAPLVLDLPASLAAHPPPVRHGTLDATGPDAVGVAFAEICGADPLDGCVVLAGYAPPKGPAEAAAADAWDDALAANLRSAFLCARAALPRLRLGRSPSLVLTSSGLAFRPSAGHAAYAAAKAGVASLARTLAVEAAPAVRVNCVAPGAVRTAFLTGGTGRGERASGLDERAYAAALPLGRLAEPDDVVGPILFLLGPASAYVTAQALHVNGGAHSGG